MALKDFERFTSSDDDIIYHHTKSRITLNKKFFVFWHINYFFVTLQKLDEYYDKNETNVDAGCHSHIQPVFRLMQK